MNFSTFPPRERVFKVFVIMKLTVLLVILFSFNVSASALAQQITLNEKNAPLSSVFKKIEQQSSYTIIYENSLLKEAKPVTITIRDGNLISVLDRCLEGLPVTYAIVENTIILKHKEKGLIQKVKDLFRLPVKVTGKVSDTTGASLPGAGIRIKDKPAVYAQANGEFSFEAEPGDKVTISFIGYTPYIFTVSEDMPFQNIILRRASSELSEVAVVSTGYQDIPKERATGSFTQIDNALLNRSVSTNILDRIDGIASGIIFTKQSNPASPRAGIEVRGRSTLFSNAEPIIVVDNFPYDGDPGNINPNDVENITILKDAAAASAWGARSGNGVIVITTKKGALNTVPKISFNASVNIGEKPDLYYLPQLSSSEYIDVEQFLFSKGAYNNSINAGYVPLSPAVEIFLAKRNGTISAEDSIARINQLKNYDSREQLLKYYLRSNINQQYQGSVSGGSSTQKYFLSAGYDKNLSNDVTASYNRVTVNASNTYYLLKNKLEIYSGMVYTASTNKSGQGMSTTAYPYTRLADENGKPLVVTGNLRTSYAAAAGDGKLLNWLYTPLDELNNGYGTTTNSLTDYRINLSLSYKIIRGLSATALYSYEKGINENNQLYELESYYARNLINTYSQIDPATGAVTYPFPKGGILNMSDRSIKSHNGRFQVNYNNTWGKHAVNAIAGTEIRDYSSLYSYNSLYGYDPETATNQNASVSYTTDYPYFYNIYSTGRIPANSDQIGNTDRFFSYYFNGSYTYADKYIASLSARRDESNLFGVDANQKGVPLWSTGLAWVVDKENFYSAGWLPQLKLRATYGYTGNVNNSISAYLTTIAGTLAQRYNAYFTEIVNPPNPSLQWERIRNINIGADFSVKDDRLSGSIDLWRKTGIDLIGNSPIAPQTGIVLYTGNSANTLTRGIDVMLNSINLNGKLKWYTTLLYNHSNSKVTDYKVSNGSNFNVVVRNYNNPLQDYPYYALFSFRYAGLDASGNPQGYLNGEVSTDYSSIINSTDRSELVYHGSATPTSFGSLRNTFRYKAVDLSFNLTYKFGYYFRRSSLQNSMLYSTSSSNFQMSDYDKRWQKAGDELTTNVPSLIYPSDGNRETIYTYSDVLVEKGDHIRLQDIRIGYTLGRKKFLPFHSVTVFSYINNIGILWKANHFGIDPDAQLSLPVVRTIAFGLKADI